MGFDAIFVEAERLANQLVSRKVDTAEAKKVADYYRSNNFTDSLVTKYLERMSQNPPVRSKKTQPQYRALYEVWRNWRPNLNGVDKGRAFAWAIKLAQVHDQFATIRPGPSQPGQHRSENRVSLKSGDRVRCVLTSQTKSGTWKAKWVDGDLEGPISSGAPASGLSAGQEVELEVATVGDKNISFRWPKQDKKSR